MHEERFSRKCNHKSHWTEYPRHKQVSFQLTFCNWLSSAVAVYVMCNKGRTLRKVRGKGWGKKQENSYKEGRLKTKNRAKKTLTKKFLKSSLHCQAYKLYPPKGHLGMQQL